MSTTAIIGVEEEHHGQVMYIGCHWDGHLGGVGATLQQHYTAPHKVYELLSLGDLARLGATLGAAHDFDRHDELSPGTCLSFHRDRIDRGRGVRYAHSKRYLQISSLGYDYLYLFRRADNLWWTCQVDDQRQRFEHTPWIPLHAALGALPRMAEEPARPPAKPVGRFGRILPPGGQGN